MWTEKEDSRYKLGSGSALLMDSCRRGCGWVGSKCDALFVVIEFLVTVEM